MSHALLFSALAGFLCFGIVGKDKAWLMSPLLLIQHVFIIKYTLGKTIAAIKGKSAGIVLHYDLLFWVCFLFYAVGLLFLSPIYFESKLELCFVGNVIGSFIIWRNECTTFRDNGKYLFALIGLVLLCALYGWVIHYRSPDSILWGQRFTDHYDGRLASTYICPNHFAHLLQMVLPFAIMVLFLPQVSVGGKVICGYAVVMCLPPLFLTESRAGWLGTIMALGMLMLLNAFHKSKKLFALTLLIVPLFSGLFLVGSWHFSDTFQRRMMPVVEFLQGQASEGIGSASPDFRPQTWRDTLTMIEEKPWFGHGPGAYRYSYPPYRETFKGKRIVTGHPHNEYLELAADYGWIGFGLFAAAWMATLVKLIQSAHRAQEARHRYMGYAAIAMISGTMVHSFFDFQMHILPNAMICAFLAAIALGPLERREKSRRGYVFRSKMGLLMLSLLLLISFITTARTMGSHYLRAMAEKNFVPVRGDNEKTEKFAWLAIKIDPTNWRAYRALGEHYYDQRYFALEVAEKQECIQDEIEAYRLAYRYNPLDAQSCAGLGRAKLFLSTGQQDDQKIKLESEGFEHLRTAYRYKKYNDIYGLLLASELRNKGRYEAALSVFEEVHTLQRSPETRKNIQWLKKVMR
jgi:O-antigen ligase